jgi:hypothetical protein
MIQIDYGIPLPPAPPKGRPRGTPGKWKYPWRSMKVGDSFKFDGSNQDAWKLVHGRRATTDGWRYEAYRIVEDGEMVVRIWRVA